MRDEQVSETVIVHLPRWRVGHWRWGPSIAALLTVTYHPTDGFSTAIAGFTVPDRNQRFQSVIVPIRHSLLKRYQSRERITSQHRRQVETDRITASTAAPVPPAEEPATPPALSAVEEPKPTTKIFRLPKEDISTRITRLRDKRPTSIPPASSPAWSNALEMSNPFLVVENNEVNQDQVPTYTVVAETTTVKTTTTVFRMGKEDISERLGRRRKSEIIAFPPTDVSGDLE
jgi:hypothetical protein